MKITKRTREQAALICQMAASSSSRRRSHGTHDTCAALGVDQDSESAELAVEAFLVALSAWLKWLGPNRRPIPAFAEAEALLRCGWRPR
jgi:hypothetical protein